MREPLMHMILRLNARLCQGLSRGSFVDAAAVATQIVRLILPQLQESNQDDRQASGRTPVAVGRIRLICVPARLPRDLPDERIFCVFCSSFKVCLEESAFRVTDSDLRVLAASAVYNIGLCFHLQSLVGAANRSSLVDHALKAYRAAGMLLRPLPLSRGLAVPGPDALLLAMGITNNQGHLLEQRFDDARVLQCLRELHVLAAHTAWTEASAPLHGTVVLFPSTDSGGSIHAPSA